MISPIRNDAIRLIKCGSALSKSGLYDIDYSLNPYRGCAHACLYCYAPDVTRYRDPGNWGQTVEARVNISRVLRKEIDRIRDSTIGLATVTDPYQPAEEQLRLTRSCLEVIAKADVRLMLMTKSGLAMRDLDLLSDIDSLEFCVTLTTMDEKIGSLLEPGAPEPNERIEMIRSASEAGLNVTAMVSPFLVSSGDYLGELADLMEIIGSTGCRTISIDRLRLRPTGRARIQRLLRNIDDSAGDRVRRVISMSERIQLRELPELAKKLGRKHGLEIELFDASDRADNPD